MGDDQVQDLGSGNAGHGHPDAGLATNIPIAEGRKRKLRRSWLSAGLARCSCSSWRLCRHAGARAVRRSCRCCPARRGSTLCSACRSAPAGSPSRTCAMAGHDAGPTACSKFRATSSTSPSARSQCRPWSFRCRTRAARKCREWTTEIGEEQLARRQARAVPAADSLASEQRPQRPGAFRQGQVGWPRSRSRLRTIKHAVQRRGDRRPASSSSPARSPRRALEDLVVVAVLKGSFIFAADLIRALASRGPEARDRFHLSCELWRGHGFARGGERCCATWKAHLAGPQRRDRRRHSRIQAARFAFAKALLEDARRSSVLTCVLIDKQVPRAAAIVPDFVGFRCPPVFVVGYGMDLAQPLPRASLHRNAGKLGFRLNGLCPPPQGGGSGCTRRKANKNDQALEIIELDDRPRRVAEPAAQLVQHFARPLNVDLVRNLDREAEVGAVRCGRAARAGPCRCCPGPCPACVSPFSIICSAMRLSALAQAGRGQVLLPAWRGRDCFSPSASLASPMASPASPN